MIRPRRLTLPLDGTLPPAVQVRPIAQIDDDFFHVAVTGQATTNTFAGHDGAPAPAAREIPAPSAVAPQPAAQAQAKFCTSRGAALKFGAKFCAQCGAPRNLVVRKRQVPRSA